MRRRASAFLALSTVIGLAGCQAPPPYKPRILSVQTPAGMPQAPLNTTRQTPLQVPGAAVRPSTAVAVPVTPVGPPVGAAFEAVPVPPPGASPPPAQYVPQVQGAVVPAVPVVPATPAPVTILKEPKALPPVGDNPNP
jgi:hypothetical protein